MKATIIIAIITAVILMLSWVYATIFVIKKLREESKKDKDYEDRFFHLVGNNNWKTRRDEEGKSYLTPKMKKLKKVDDDKDEDSSDELGPFIYDIKNEPLHDIENLRDYNLSYDKDC